MQPLVELYSRTRHSIGDCAWSACACVCACSYVQCASLNSKKLQLSQLGTCRSGEVFTQIIHLRQRKAIVQKTNRNREQNAKAGDEQTMRVRERESGKKATTNSISNGGSSSPVNGKSSMRFKLNAMALHH